MKDKHAINATYPRAEVIQLLTVLAFSIVSAVVKVFDTITTGTSNKIYFRIFGTHHGSIVIIFLPSYEPKVVSGERPCKLRETSIGSTLAKLCASTIIDMISNHYLIYRPNNASEA